MTEQSLKLRSARRLREHWLEQVEVARRANDRELEARARQFVAQYEQLIAGIERGDDNR